MTHSFIYVWISYIYHCLQKHLISEQHTIHELVLLRLLTLKSSNRYRIHTMPRATLKCATYHLRTCNANGSAYNIEGKQKREKCRNPWLSCNYFIRHLTTTEMACLCIIHSVCNVMTSKINLISHSRLTYGFRNWFSFFVVVVECTPILSTTIVNI